jgi:TolB-like protein/tetratricopeptide (TPR) repeat protein
MPSLLGLGVVVVVLALTMFWPGRGLEEPAEASGIIPTAQTEVASIAVLPFADMSPGADQEYFADGLSEELLNALVKIRDLRVAARTSSFSFKGKDVTVADIGRELNVGTVLEGSVRKAGNRVRITAQLVNVEDGFHLWSETYDRELSDIFAVQDEIARSVAGELQVRLVGTGGVMSNSSRRVDPAAYTAYLQGRFIAERRTKADLWKAVNYFEEALDLAPNYAPIWAGLATTRLYLMDFGHVLVDAGYPQARTEVDRALELDENFPEAYVTLARLKTHYEHDWTGAKVALQRALKLEPGNADVVAALARFAGLTGRFDEAVVLSRRAVQLDPLAAYAHRYYGIHALRAGLPAESLAAFKRAVELAPNAPQVHRWLGIYYLHQGLEESALSEMKLEHNLHFGLEGLAIAYHALGRLEESDRAMNELIKVGSEVSAMQIACAYAYRGELDRAFEWMERAYVQRDAGTSMMKVYPALESLYDDPRWKPFLEKVGLPE